MQLEETERQFDEFWQRHSSKLNHWLSFRTFLLDFKEMQVRYPIFIIYFNLFVNFNIVIHFTITIY